MSVRMTLGISLKMYFGWQQTAAWCREVADILHPHPLTHKPDELALFTFPSSPAIDTALRAFAGSVMEVGAQNISPEPPGAWTGETSAAMLAEMGCGYAEIGHAERRRHFGETDDLIARKVRIALKHRLTPVVCIGEPHQVSAAEATRLAIGQASTVLDNSQEIAGDVIFAWEPQWAIGAPQPAPDDYVRQVCAGLREYLSVRTMGKHRVIYGGSAGPGLLTRLWPDVDGLFLGRFAHQPAALQAVLDEAHELLS